MAASIPVVFIDTNVWFSAFYRSQTAEKLVVGHIEDKIRAVISQDILNELIRNVTLKIPHAIQPLQIFLKIAPPMIIRTPSVISPAVKQWVDPKDQSIFAACIEAEIPFFITGNIKDFDCAQLQKKYHVTILTPREAVETLGL